jgi:hypothetical protein
MAASGDIEEDSTMRSGVKAVTNVTEEPLLALAVSFWPFWERLDGDFLRTARRIHDQGNEGSTKEYLDNVVFIGLI